MKKWVFYIGVIILLGVNLWLLRQSYPYFKEYGGTVLDKIHSSEVKIFVTYHKPYQLPAEGKVLQPIQVGRAVEKEPFDGGQLSDEDIEWLHKWMIGDDTGENISKKNRAYDVLTAYYWVWKHYNEIGNPKYIGFLAHRKFLSANDENLKFNRYAVDFGYKEQQLKALLKKHKIITHWWIPYYNGAPVSVYEDYSNHHYIQDLDAMIALIRKHYPEMTDAMQNVLMTVDKPCSIWNFWIMEKNLAFDYFEKLFYIMFELEKERGTEIAKYDLSERRTFGYLAERFFAIWVEYQTKLRKADPLFADVQYL